MRDKTQDDKQNLQQTATEAVSEADTIEQDAPVVAAAPKRKLAGMQILAIFIIILALIMFALPFVNSALIKRYSQLNLNAITASELQRNQQNDAHVAFEDIEEIGIINIWPWLNKYDRDNIVGLLNFPSLDIKLPIFNSASNENLLAGVATLKPEQKMGQGNYTISGHRARGKGVLLHNLMDAEIGSVVKLSDKEKIYIYRVVDALQVENEAVHMLDDAQMEKYGNKPLLSIMTCHFGKSTSRWFVIASLEEIVDYSDAEFNRPD
ncbi:MAG: class A sortase [Eubacteriales bacterium]|nr:class A sortase [Eubacteriales bacterium]